MSKYFSKIFVVSILSRRMRTFSRNCLSVKSSAEMENKTVMNRKILRRVFCSLVKLQTVKRGKVLRVKVSARNEKQNCQSKENLSFAQLLWLALT